MCGANPECYTNVVVHPANLSTLGTSPECTGTSARFATATSFVMFDVGMTVALSLLWIGYFGYFCLSHVSDLIKGIDEAAAS